MMEEDFFDVETVGSTIQTEQTESVEQSKEDIQIDITEAADEVESAEQVQETEAMSEEREPEVETPPTLLSEETTDAGDIEKAEEPASPVEDTDFDVDAVIVTGEAERGEEEILNEDMPGESESVEEDTEEELELEESGEMEPAESLEDIDVIIQMSDIESKEKTEEDGKEVPTAEASTERRKSLIDMIQEKSHISKGTIHEVPSSITRSAIQETISAVSARTSVSSEDAEQGIMEATTIEPKIDDYTLAKRSKHRYANTYQLEPNYVFQVDRVTSIIQELLNQVLSGKKYDRVVAMQVARELSGVILNKVKHLGYKRHKFVSIVYVGQKKSQSVTLVASGLWDVQHDNFASATFESCELFAIGCLFATYYE